MALTRGSKCCKSRSGGKPGLASGCASTRAIDRPLPLSAAAKALPAMPAPIIAMSTCRRSAIVLLRGLSCRPGHRGNTRRMAHKLALKGRQDIQPGQSQVPRQAKQRVGVHEQAWHAIAEIE